MRIKLFGQSNDWAKTTSFWFSSLRHFEEFGLLKKRKIIIHLLEEAIDAYTKITAAFFNCLLLYWDKHLERRLFSIVKSYFEIREYFTICLFIRCIIFSKMWTFFRQIVNTGSVFRKFLKIISVSLPMSFSTWYIKI